MGKVHYYYRSFVASTLMRSAPSIKIGAMDFDLSKPQKLLRDSARALLSRECPHEKVRALAQTETASDEGLWQTIADQGWLGLLIAEEYGGLGLGLVDLCVVVEEMGRACLPGPFLSTQWAAALIERAGSEGQRRQFLDAISMGTLKATVALMEEQASWNRDAVTLECKVDGRQIILNGRKLFVTDAQIADCIICVARSGDELVFVPVPGGIRGMTITATPGIDPTRKLYSVDFDNVRVAANEILEAARDAGQALDQATDVATVALSAEMLGGMQWVLGETVEYAKTRKQFDRPIGTYQAVQHQCADMFLQTESARSAAYYAAWAVSERDPSARLAVSIAKAYCSDASREVGNRGIQVHGGIGFTWEHNLHLYYKRAKASEIMFGDANYHRERIARYVIDEAE
jgi:alkylation response protein AidB-like acyl-CoA dehydrogenase